MLLPRPDTCPTTPPPEPARRPLRRGPRPHHPHHGARAQGPPPGWPRRTSRRPSHALPVPHLLCLHRYLLDQPPPPHPPNRRGRRTHPLRQPRLPLLPLASALLHLLRPRKEDGLLLGRSLCCVHDPHCIQLPDPASRHRAPPPPRRRTRSGGQGRRAQELALALRLCHGDSARLPAPTLCTRSGCLRPRHLDHAHHRHQTAGRISSSRSAIARLGYPDSA